MPQRNGPQPRKRASADTSLSSLDEAIFTSMSFLMHEDSASSCTTPDEVTRRKLWFDGVVMEGLADLTVVLRPCMRNA
ncbi:hypothetical protein K443DRAFT_15885 [Laccaria amethystina LaAM-08-1]|uniref:Uncharacterized protein n=1 Tax=Laccaria amethystina LaAM-08-1 TaxID=1095629 RepID=A0A0C9WPW4_9AGAR|nr:hypothetical protein K443DRAFT_15885 [Laccaria amethystina LaAM-08-1]